MTEHKKYLETAFTQVIMDLQSETGIATKDFIGDTKFRKRFKKQERINELIKRKNNDSLNLEMMDISPKTGSIRLCLRCTTYSS